MVRYESSKAEHLRAQADAVLSVAGATVFKGLEVSRLAYFGTNPVFHEVSYTKFVQTSHGFPDKLAYQHQASCKACVAYLQDGPRLGGSLR